MRTARPTRLAAALGAGVLLTGLGATPALASPAHPAGWTAEHGLPGGSFLVASAEGETGASFGTEFEVDESDVRLTVAPVLEGEARGAETEVPFTYDDELERGDFDVAAARRSLGESGAGPVVYTLYVLGGEVAALTYGPDADLTDADPGEPLRADQRHELGFHMLPTVWDTTLLAAPGERYVFISSNTGDEAAPLTLVAGPAEGRVVEVTEEETGGPRGYVYQAPEGFAGSDTVTLRATRDGVTTTRTVTVRFGDPRVDLYDWENGWIPGFVTFPVAGLFDDASAPGQPADPDTPTSPADPETPAEPAEGEHTVPDTVETGRGPAAWPVAVAVLAAGVLAVVRRHRVAA